MKWFLVHIAIFFMLNNVVDATYYSQDSPEDILPGLNFYFRNDIHQDHDHDARPVVVPSELLSLKVNAKVIDGIAEVSLLQQFQTPDNVSDLLVLSGASYQIPLDELAAVTEFRAEIDDRIIEAVVKERTEAERDFIIAIESGVNAFLAEQERADIFKISVGNIPPGKIVKVTLVYITHLEAIDANNFRFIFPTGIAPRYQPAINSELPISDDSTILMDSGVDIQLNISMATEITNITCNTHDTQVSLHENTLNQAMVTVIDEDPQERDLVIHITTVANYEPQVYIESSPQYNTTAIMLSFVPDFSLDLLDTDAKTEFIFIIDRSGSMEGEKIKQLQQAMSLIIDLIPSDSLFNIIGFGESFSALFDGGSQNISDINVRNITQEYINSIEADFGGTEILKPLEYVLGGNEMPVLSTYDRVLIVMTDGQVSNTDDTIEYVQQHQQNGRVFSLGIGEQVSALLVRGLARAGRGTAEFVDGSSSENIKDAVQRQIEVASTPALSNVVIQLAALEKSSLSQAPFVTPPLLIEKRFLIFFIADGIDSIPEKVVVSSNVQGTSNMIDYEVNSNSFHDMSIPNNGLDSNLIHKMACRSLIRDLEEGASKFHEEGYSENDIDAEIIRLGLLYQIASSQTSFVAIDNYGWNESSMNDFLNDDDDYYNPTTSGATNGCIRGMSRMEIFFSFHRRVVAFLFSIFSRLFLNL